MDVTPYEFPVADPCPACEWLAGRQPWAPIFVNDLAAAHLSSRQRTRGASCVITRRHVCTLSEFTEAETIAVADLVQRVVVSLERTFSPDGMHIWESTGVLASQHRPHAHVNIVPRYANEPYTFSPSFDLPVVPVERRQELARLLGAAFDGSD